MQEMDRVEVIVEKERYANDGVHKGMQGWICDPQTINGTWLVNFPQMGEHADIATIAVKEEDMRTVLVMHAMVNERIRAEWENKQNGTAVVKIVKLDLTDCLSDDELRERMRIAFHVREWYGQDWEDLWSVMWSESGADKVEIYGENTICDRFADHLKKFHDVLDKTISFCRAYNLTPFSYEIMS